MGFLPLVGGQIHHIRGAGYLIVDQIVNRRHGSKVSTIWQYGMELRALYSSKLDKYWLCSSLQCERAFSSVKKLITPERNSLGDNITEALF